MKSRRRIPLSRLSARSLKIVAAVAFLLVCVSVGPGLVKSVFASHSTVQAASWTSGPPAKH